MKKWIIIGILLLIVGLALFFGIRYYKNKKAESESNSQFAATSGSGIGDRYVDENGNVTVTGTVNASAHPTAANFSKVQYHFGTLSSFPEFGAKRATVSKAGKTYCGDAKEWSEKNCKSRGIPKVGASWNRYKQRREYCLNPFMQVYGYKCDSDCDV